ncbi:MAG TPA: class IV adenylate cyclase [Phycisphaerae bacterium]|nr:class IV adenylate cyclase [Phycisphaerales bacterium]HRX84772.1 class IV adenylate cyclase [Phycisphaerae bacterium]
MALEIEAKFKVDAFDAVRAALAAVAADRVGRRHETNHMLDRRDDPLAQHDSALRVRACRALDGPPQSSRLTFKGPVQASRFKVREELEVAIDDAAGVVAILERLGFRTALVYEKRRETWRLGDCRIELDELPELGCFVEIEAPDERTVEAVCHQLGLTGAEPITASYVHLLLGHCAAADPQRREFRFPA